MSSDEDQKSDEESLGEQLYQEALKDTAGDLHVDLIHEPHLVHYVELALHSPPPDGWEERVDETSDGISFTYFLHTSTQERSRTNPSFQTFEDQIQRARLSHSLSSNNNESHSINRQDSMIMAAMQGIPGLLPTDENEEGKSEKKENKEGNKQEDKIEKVLARRLLKNGKTEYKVHWSGTRSNEDEWFLHSKLVGDARLKQMLDTFDSLHQTIEERPVAEWTAREVCACIVVLRRLMESHPDELLKCGYASMERQSYWQDTDSASSEASIRTCEWVASAALSTARRGKGGGQEKDLVLAAAGVGQWCQSILHIVRTLSEILVPEEVLRPHIESGVTPIHLREVIAAIRSSDNGRGGESERRRELDTLLDAANRALAIFVQKHGVEKVGCSSIIYVTSDGSS